MEQLKVLMGTVDIMNNTEAVLDTVEDMVGNSESNGSAPRVPAHTGAWDTPGTAFPCTQCNDGERAILLSYVSLMRQCIELAEKVAAAKA